MTVLAHGATPRTPGEYAAFAAGVGLIVAGIALVAIPAAARWRFLAIPLAAVGTIVLVFGPLLVDALLHA